MISSQLAFYDVKDIKILGTSLWNSPYLLKKGAEYLEGAVFPDSFFIYSFYPETNDFVDIYYTAYSRDPENIEALSYDTAQMIFNVLKNQGIQTRRELVATLMRLLEFRQARRIVLKCNDRLSHKT